MKNWRVFQILCLKYYMLFLYFCFFPLKYPYKWFLMKKFRVLFQWWIVLTKVEQITLHAMSAQKQSITIWFKNLQTASPAQLLVHSDPAVEEDLVVMATDSGDQLIFRTDNRMNLIQICKLRIWKGMKRA